MSEQFEMIAKTFQGLEEILAEELTTLGANDIQIGRRMVSFTGDKRMMYKANFCLRTAIRILKPIKNFTAKDADEVYNEIQAIPWEEYLDVNKTFAIDAVVFSEEFRHSKFVSYKVKDAIVDYFREKTGKRPSVRCKFTLLTVVIVKLVEHIRIEIHPFLKCKSLTEYARSDVSCYQCSFHWNSTRTAHRINQVTFSPPAGHQNHTGSQYLVQRSFYGFLAVTAPVK